MISNKIKSQNKFSIAICFLLMVISGCSDNSIKCSDSNVYDTLIASVRDHYNEKLDGFLDFSVVHSEHNKNDKGDFIKSCTGTIETKFNDDTTKKYKELDEEVSKINSFQFEGGAQLLKDKVTIEYKIKKKESGDGYFISSNFISENEWALKLVVLERIRDYDKIIKIAHQLKQLENVNNLLGTKKPSGAELFKMVVENDLGFDFCEQNNNSDSYSLTCRISNEAGYIDAQHLREFSHLEIEMSKFFGMGTVGGQSNKITDMAKIKDGLNEKIYFSSIDDVKSQNACKIAPSICKNY